MKLKFFGPLGRVTGSSALLWCDRLGVRILVDAGLQQGEGDSGTWNRGPLPFDASSLTHVILTHAHIDHSGLLPRLYENGFSGRVICTPETAALTRLLLADSARVSGLHTERDAAEVDFDERKEPFGKHFPIARDVFVGLTRSAHILGSVSARVCWGRPGPEQRSITFSGDLGPNVFEHERFLMLGHRMTPRPSTFAVVESTYGHVDRARVRLKEESFIGRVNALGVALRDGISRGGTILLPVFATDRLQMLLLDLAYLFSVDATLASVPVFVHAPLGRKVCATYAKFVSAKDLGRPRDGVASVYPRWLSHSSFERLGLGPATPESERRLERALVAILDPEADGSEADGVLVRAHRWVDCVLPPAEGPRVILVSGGMLQGGAVMAYLPSVLRDPSSTLLLAGYAAPKTTAGELLQLSVVDRAQRERLSHDIVLADGSSVAAADVRAHIGSLAGYSAHADQRGLLQWLVSDHGGTRQLAGGTVFLTHGTDHARRALREELSAQAPGVEVICPTPDDCEFDLDETPQVTTPQSFEERLAHLEARLARLERERH